MLRSLAVLPWRHQLSELTVETEWQKALKENSEVEPLLLSPLSAAWARTLPSMPLRHWFILLHLLWFYLLALLQPCCIFCFSLTLPSMVNLHPSFRSQSKCLFYSDSSPENFFLSATPEYFSYSVVAVGLRWCICISVSCFLRQWARTTSFSFLYL